MLLNIPKTVGMLIGTVQRLRTAINQFSVGEREYQITEVSNYKLLGVHVDNHLTWDTHVAHLCCKIRSRLHVLNKTKFILHHYTRLDYSKGVIQPIIDSGCVVWGNCRKVIDQNTQTHVKVCNIYPRHT